MMTEPSVVEMLLALIGIWKPKSIVELGSGPSTTLVLQQKALAIGATFVSVDTDSFYSTHPGDAVAYLKERKGDVDFLFSDAGGWQTRVDCAKLAPQALAPGGFAAFHDIQGHTPLRPVLDALGAVDLIPPGFTEGSAVWGGLALWRNRP